MTRKTYYNILLFGLGFIFIYSLLGIFSFSLFNIHLPRPYFGYLMDVFVFYIVIFETINARKQIFWLNVLFIFAAIASRLFIVMHWPYGLLVYVLSTSTIIGLLVYDIIKTKSDVQLRVIIFLYPVSRLIFQVIFSNHLYIPWWFIDLLALGIITAHLIFRLVKNNRKLP